MLGCSFYSVFSVLLNEGLPPNYVSSTVNTARGEYTKAHTKRLVIRSIRDRR